jgi:hypothetical protein
MNHYNCSCNTTSIDYNQIRSFNLFDYINFVYKVTYVIVPIINIMSFLMNFICVLVFLKVLKNKRSANEPASSSIMYKYLLLKSICDTVSSIIQMTVLIFKENNYYGYLIRSIWSLVFYLYFSQSFYLASGFFEIAATFNCAVSIENKLKWLQTKLSFYITTIGLFAFCFVYQSFYFIFKHIQTKELINNSTVTIFYFINDSFLYYKTEQNFEFSTSIIRDLVCLLILIILNAFILFKMIQIRRRRSHLQSNSQSANQLNSRRAEHRKIKMILFLFIVYALGHLPFTLVHLNLLDPIIRNYVIYYAKIFLAISYSTSFFIYFFFDKKFNSVIMPIFSVFRNFRRRER